MADNDTLNAVDPQNPTNYGPKGFVNGTTDQTRIPAPSAQPTAVQPVAPSASVAPAALAQPAPTPQQARVSLHAHMFDRVLNAFGGGTQYINRTDPATGATTQEPVPQSKGQLGRNILAAAITGMITGAGARDSEGRHDPLKAGAAGFEAGKQPMEKKVAELQKTSDEDISRRQMTMKANMDLLHQQVAMTQLQHQTLQATADGNKAGILADAQTFDEGITDSKMRAIQGTGLTHEQALAKLDGNWDSTLAIVDGYQDVQNPQTGKMETHPTYAVLNPNVQIKMSEENAAKLATFKPAYKNAYEATGGNLKMSLTRYVQDWHQLNSLNHADAFLSDIDDKLGIKATAPNLAKLTSDPKGGQQILNAVKDIESSQAQGGSPVDVLHRLSGTGGGTQILRAMGISDTQVQKLWNEQTSANKLAEQGGMGEKAPADQTQVDALVQSINTNPDMTGSDKKALMVDVPSAGKDGVVHMNQGQVAKVVARQDAVIASNKSIAEKNALANGDPVQMQKTASNIIEGDINNITKIASMRGNARINTFNALHDEAVARGLDPTDYSEAAMTAKDAAVTSYGTAGKIGQQITSFRTFLGHESEAADANDAWKRMNSPLLNKPMAWIAKNAANDPNYIRLKTALGAPAKEYMSFLNANRAEHEADIAQMDTVLDVNSTPLQINTALKELAKTADFRLGSLGKGFISTVGTTYPGLMDPSSAATLKKCGIDSTAAKVAVPLTRGWAAGKAQQMTDVRMAKAYFEAAGSDREAAKALAKKNGWILQ